MLLLVIQIYVVQLMKKSVTILMDVLILNMKIRVIVSQRVLVLILNMIIMRMNVQQLVKYGHLLGIYGLYVFGIYWITAVVDVGFLMAMEKTLVLNG